jgi:hypothetical protein
MDPAPEQRGLERDDMIPVALKAGLILRRRYSTNAAVSRREDHPQRAARWLQTGRGAALVNKRKGLGRGFQVVSAEPLDPKSARFNWSSIFRLRWQPPPSCFHTGVSQSCQRTTEGSGACPCSIKSSSPSGFRTRRISRTARATSGMEHKVKVMTTVSKLRSSNGKFSPEPFNQFHRDSHGIETIAGFRQKLGRRVDSINLFRTRAV